MRDVNNHDKIWLRAGINCSEPAYLKIKNFSLEKVLQMMFVPAIERSVDSTRIG